MAFHDTDETEHTKAEPGQHNHVDVSVAEERLRAGDATIDPFAKLHNMEVLWADGTDAEGVMHVTPVECNVYGVVHGGCLVALADNVAGHNVVASGGMCVTQSSTLNFLRPVSGKIVRCCAHMQKKGKQISVVSVEMTDENEKLVASGLFTFFTVKAVPPRVLGNKPAGA